MSVVVIGCHHRSTPLSLLERMTIPAADVPKALFELGQAEHLSEAVVLSTCNRIEVYVLAEKFHGALHDVREFLALQSGIAPDEVSDLLYAYHDAEAARHLFSVAAGLDSAVIGEHEILGQVRNAWEIARDENLAGSSLGPLFRHALETGKRARSETGIGRGIASVSQAAVAMADQRIDLAGRKVLVIGGGEMAERTIGALAHAGVADIAIANRTWDRAVELAERFDGRAVPLDQLRESLILADFLVTTTGAQDLILEHNDLDDLLDARSGRDLLIVDMAVPRDVDPVAGEIFGITLLDMDDIGEFVAGGVAGREREVSAVRAIVEHEVDRYQHLISAREVAPLITGLRKRADDVRIAELGRFGAKLEGLSADQRDAVDALTRGIINKLLHEPTVKLKDAAGRAKGDRLADAMRDLFDLD